MNIKILQSMVTTDECIDAIEQAYLELGYSADKMKALSDAGVI